jgi:hypothetical protein
MNGFANPWRGIRSDPGHDYRGRYLAQQGWVLHFTKDSVSCRAEGHNACLPNCNDPLWRLDHNYCSDEGLRQRLRNPLLFYDDKQQGGAAKVPEGLDVATGENRRWTSLRYPDAG